MIESLLKIAGLILLVAFAACFGISFDAAELISASIIGCVVLAVVVRSAYRDARRRQSWPGKNQKRP